MTLHSLACHGWAECRCAVVYRVRETDARARAYDEQVGVDAGDSSGARNRIDSATAPPGRLSPGSGGALLCIEGIVR